MRFDLLGGIEYCLQQYSVQTLNWDFGGLHTGQVALQRWTRFKKFLPVTLRLFWVFEPWRGGVFHHGDAVTLGDAPGGGGTRSEVRSKKKGCHNDDLTVFSGRSSLWQPFFFTTPFSLNPPRPASDAPPRLWRSASRRFTGDASGFSP